jgi:hypothetical protein
MKKELAPVSNAAFIHRDAQQILPNADISREAEKQKIELGTAVRRDVRERLLTQTRLRVSFRPVPQTTPVWRDDVDSALKNQAKTLRPTPKPKPMAMRFSNSCDPSVKATRLIFWGSGYWTRMIYSKNSL